MEERSVQILIPYERSFSVEWLVEGEPFYVKFCINQSRWSKSPIFNRYSLVAPQP